MKRILSKTKPSDNCASVVRTLWRTTQWSETNHQLRQRPHRILSPQRTFSNSFNASSAISITRTNITARPLFGPQTRFVQTISNPGTTNVEENEGRSAEKLQETTAAHTKIATTTLESKWRSMSDEIFGLPVGTFNHGRWNEAISVLTYWFHDCGDATRFMKDTVTIEECWKFLDRLFAELVETNNRINKQQIEARPSPKLSTVGVLNPFLRIWRDDFLNYHRKRIELNRGGGDSIHDCDRTVPPRLPSEVAKLLRKYQKYNLVVRDVATHTIILDTAGKYSAAISSWSKDLYGCHNQGIFFADRYLREWIESYQISYTNDNDRIRSLPSKQLNDRIVPRPDIMVFATLVHAWAESGLPGAPTKAELWVKTFNDLEREYPNKLQPIKFPLYNSVLLAFARAGDPTKTGEWIDRMIREEEYPDVRAFNSLLISYQSAMSKAKKATINKNYAERAEGVLRQMQTLYHDPNGFLTDPPNIYSYSLVIDIWTKQVECESRRNREKAIYAARRAHSWLEQMKDLGMPVNVITYNTVITAYSRAGLPQESEKILQEMIAAYRNDDGSIDRNRTSNLEYHQKTTESGNSDNSVSLTTIKPDVKSFTSVILGWARVGTFEAAERADKILQLMQLPEVNIEPNAKTYGVCIDCWARVAGGTHKRGSIKSQYQMKTAKEQREYAVKRAEAHFHEMREKWNISPDAYAYTALLNTYGRSGRSRQAHRFLESCLEEYSRTGDPRMKPTVVTFTAILNAWSKATNAPEAAEKAHELLYRMKDQYGIEPNAFSYSSVLNAYSRSKHHDAASKALSLFRDMREIAGLEPNAYTCSNVLKAMARGGKIEEAEKLLFELVYDDRVKTMLGTHAFSEVLYGWSKSRRTDAPERAEALLIKMQELYSEKKIDGPPNNICWNNLLACWAHSKLPGAAQRADDLLKRILQQQREQQIEKDEASFSGGNSRSKFIDIHHPESSVQDHPSIRCDRSMYNTVINAWANDGNFAKANELYLELLEQHQLDSSYSPPDGWTYRALWKSIVKTSNMGAAEKLQRMQKIIVTMADAGLKPDKNMNIDLERFQNRNNRL